MVFKKASFCFQQMRHWYFLSYFDCVGLKHSCKLSSDPPNKRWSLYSSLWIWAGFVACFGQSGCQEQLGEAEKGEREGGVVIYSICIYSELKNKPFQIFHYSNHKIWGDGRISKGLQWEKKNEYLDYISQPGK